MVRPSKANLSFMKPSSPKSPCLTISRDWSKILVNRPKGFGDGNFKASETVDLMSATRLGDSMLMDSPLGMYQNDTSRRSSTGTLVGPSFNSTARPRLSFMDASQQRKQDGASLKKRSELNFVKKWSASRLSNPLNVTTSLNVPSQSVPPTIGSILLEDDIKCLHKQELLWMEFSVEGQSSQKVCFELFVDNDPQVNTFFKYMLTSHMLEVQAISPGTVVQGKAIFFAKSGFKKVLLGAAIDYKATTDLPSFADQRQSFPNLSGGILAINTERENM